MQSAASALTPDVGAVPHEGAVGDGAPRTSPGSVRVWRPEEFEGLELQQVTASSWPVHRELLVEYQVTLGVAGHGSLFYSGNQHAFSSDFLGVFQPGEVVSGAPQGTWTHHTLRFTQELLKELTAGEPAYLPSAYPKRIRGSLRPLWFAAFTGFTTLNTSIERESRLLSALDSLLKHATTRPQGPPRREHAACLRAMRFLELHFAQNLTLSDLAREARLSKYHLLRSFQHTVGVSPHEYQTCLRIRYAKQLLSRGAPLAAVAIDAGFSDQAHLTRKFKGLVGVTPGQYR